MNPNEIGAAAIIGFYTPHVLQWLKRQPWFPLMKQGEAALNRATAWAVAVLTSLGIHWTVQTAADGSGSLMLMWPHLTVLGVTADILRQYAIQKWSYATTVGDHPQ